MRPNSHSSMETEALTGHDRSSLETEALTGHDRSSLETEALIGQNACNEYDMIVVPGCCGCSSFAWYVVVRILNFVLCPGLYSVVFYYTGKRLWGYSAESESEGDNNDDVDLDDEAKPSGFACRAIAGALVLVMLFFLCVPPSWVRGTDPHVGGAGDVAWMQANLDPMTLAAKETVDGYVQLNNTSGGLLHNFLMWFGLRAASFEGAAVEIAANSFHYTGQLPLHGIHKAALDTFVGGMLPSELYFYHQLTFQTLLSTVSELALPGLISTPHKRNELEASRSVSAAYGKAYAVCLEQAWGADVSGMAACLEQAWEADVEPLLRKTVEYVAGNGLPTKLLLAGVMVPGHAISTVFEYSALPTQKWSVHMFNRGGQSEQHKEFHLDSDRGSPTADLVLEAGKVILLHVGSQLAPAAKAEDPTLALYKKLAQLATRTQNHASLTKRQLMNSCAHDNPRQGFRFFLGDAWTKNGLACKLKTAVGATLKNCLSTPAAKEFVQTELIDGSKRWRDEFQPLKTLLAKGVANPGLFTKNHSLCMEKADQHFAALVGETERLTGLLDTFPAALYKSYRLYFVLMDVANQHVSMLDECENKKPVIPFPHKNDINLERVLLGGLTSYPEKLKQTQCEKRTQCVPAVQRWELLYGRLIPEIQELYKFLNPQSE